MTSEPMPVARRAVRVRGGVQGVGFRPFVYGLAARFHLAGIVGNDSDGVFIEVEGKRADLDAFVQALRTDAPPLASIESIVTQSQPHTGDTGFTIVSSRVDAHYVTPVVADVATCEDCLRELRTPGDRRYRYPFINCTNCGPRYTIVVALPYDRARTTMREFRMCDACAGEYADPLDRRYHAQPNACADCGPRLSWCPGTGGEAAVHDHTALDAAIHALSNGHIVAVQGIGGFHIACRADDDAAVALLRARKRRPDKPLAVMVSDVSAALALATIDDLEIALLSSPAHPIVLLARRADARLAPLVAPGHDTIGIMLAYSPLHHLLCTDGPLVLTSGNLADEPIAFVPDDAFLRFTGLVDGVLFHNRAIHAPADDSVMRVALGLELPIRRSRGYAPYPVALPRAMPSVLAVGGELKATICLTRDAHAFLSPHIGDVANLETEIAMTRTVLHLQQLFGVEPSVIAADMSPAYRSTVWATQFATERGLTVHHVQHHHAHVASLMAEHGLSGDSRVLGVTFDGTGYGADDSIWGGEFLLADYRSFERVAHLAPTLLPGGDAAVRHPARMALAYLHSAAIPWSEALYPSQALTSEVQRVLQQQLSRGVLTRVTTSAGRFLDACAALCGVRQTVTYEGQAAIEFEALAAQAPPDDRGHYTFPIAMHDAAPMQVTLASFWSHLLFDLRRGRDRRRIAFEVHSALADAIVMVARHVRDTRGTRDALTVGLTGGVFQNVLLLTLSAQRLRDAGFEVITHRRVPPNDGGLALGQAMIAAAALEV